MSERLLGEHLESLTERLVFALRGEAACREELIQIGDLLTALGVETIAAAPDNTTRRLSLTERIVRLWRSEHPVHLPGVSGGYVDLPDEDHKPDPEDDASGGAINHKPDLTTLADLRPLSGPDDVATGPE